MSQLIMPRKVSEIPKILKQPIIYLFGTSKPISSKNLTIITNRL
jgi:hypothetical protein